MQESCVFCRIISGEFSSDVVYQDDDILVIKDITPVAPIHVLIIPKKHSKNILETDSKTLSLIMDKITVIAEILGVKENGFRTVINTGEEAGQTVGHLHIHLLSGRNMTWPPG